MTVARTPVAAALDRSQGGWVTVPMDEPEALTELFPLTYDRVTAPKLS